MASPPKRTLWPSAWSAFAGPQRASESVVTAGKAPLRTAVSRREDLAVLVKRDLGRRCQVECSGDAPCSGGGFRVGGDAGVVHDAGFIPDRPGIVSGLQDEDIAG